MRLHRCAPLVRPNLGLAVTLLLVLSGCSLFEPEEKEQIFVSEIEGPDRAAAGETVVFSLHGFALDASVRIERRAEEHLEVTVWADPQHHPEGWCGTPPHPQLGLVEATVPEAGAYTVRVFQPDGSVLEKRVTVED